MVLKLSEMKEKLMNAEADNGVEGVVMSSAGVVPRLEERNLGE